MGIETNPQTVDDLNQAWPAKEEPVKEGHRHLQNIKKAVKARANAAGQYGVTTLTNALTEDLDTKAASARAAKTLRDLITGLEGDLAALSDALGGVDTSVGENAVPLNGLWPVTVGDNPIFNWRHTCFDSSNLLEFSPLATVLYSETFWRNLGTFTCFNSGSFRFKFSAFRSQTSNDGQLEIRLLKNDVVAWSISETRASMLNEGNWGDFKDYTADINCAPGDYFKFEFRWAALPSFATSVFLLREFSINTGTKPAVLSCVFHPAANYRFVASVALDGDGLRSNLIQTPEEYHANDGAGA